MRRIVLICLLLMLPTQWTWAAVASACRHESGTAARHLGHHEHEHHHGQAAAAAQGDAGADTTGPGFDADCATCHGHGLTAMISAAALPQCRPGGLVPSLYTRHLVDRVPEHPLRPPLSSHLA